MNKSTRLYLGPSTWERFVGACAVCLNRAHSKWRVARHRVRQVLNDPRYLGRAVLFFGIWALLASSAVYSLRDDEVKAQEKLKYVQASVSRLEARNAQLTARLSESRAINKRLAGVLADKNKK